MRRRAGIVAGFVVLVAALGWASPSEATVDTQYGWDYQSMAINTAGLIPIRGNFGGDNAADILWYAPGSGPDTIWYGRTGQRGSNAFRRARVNINGTYKPITGDFVGDEATDILWYAPGSTADFIWAGHLGGTTFTSMAAPVGGNFQAYALRDFNTDHKDDVLWYDPSTAADYLWHFADDGTGAKTSTKLVLNRTFRIAVGDFDGNRSSDVMLYAPSTPSDLTWYFNEDGTYRVDSIVLYEKAFIPTTVYQEVEDDVLFWQSGTPRERYFEGGPSGSLWEKSIRSMDWEGVPYSLGLGALIVVPNGPEILLSSDGTELEWYQLQPANRDQAAGTIPVTGDFDGDGYLDIVWYGPGTKPDALWYTQPPSSDRAKGDSPASDRHLVRDDSGVVEATPVS
jgi:hypothetical protein